MNDAMLIEIQRLCRLVHTRGLRELAVTSPDFSVMLTAVQRGAAIITPAAGAAVAPVVPMAEAVAEPPAATVSAGTPVTSPLVGVFYRAASPDAPSFVEVGDQVEVGQVIGIVEAMKVFNEITSDYAGTVLAIPVENGKLVHVGDPLVMIDQEAAGA